MDKMIVICAYGNNFILENLKYIRKYNKNNKIVIVNNGMTVSKKSIEEGFSDLKISIIDTKDNLREIGSWWIACKNFPNESWYCFIHDSMYIKKDASYLIPKEGVFVFSSKKGWNGNHHMKSKVGEEFYNIIGKPTSNIYLVFGCMFACPNSVIKKLKLKGITNIHAKSRSEAMSSERLMGLCFQRMNISMKVFTRIIPCGKKGNSAASGNNQVRTENDLYVKIRSGR
jgi:hypothetical protein